MASRSRLLGGSGHKCMLGLTLILLLSEMVVSRLCNSLINMVDCFHTLYILLHMSLFHTAVSGVPPTPFLANPYTPTLTSSQPTSQALSPNSTSPPISTLNPSAPNGPSSVPAISTLLSVSPVPQREPYSRARIQPFGALTSALLLASLCVSIMLEILSRTLEPQPIQRPLLATVAGALSLLFNVAVLALSWERLLKTQAAGFARCPRPPVQLNLYSGLAETAKVKVQPKAVTATEVEEAGGDLSGDLSPALESSLQDGTLVFCNPGASSVLDPDVDYLSCTPLSLRPHSLTGPTHGLPEPSAQVHTAIQGSSGGCERPHSLLPSEARVLQLTAPHTEGAKYTGCVGHTDNQMSVSQSIPEVARLGGLRVGCLQSLFAVVQGLLGSVLVLANGLAMLLSDPECLHPQGPCHLFVYLDPGFSMVAVLVLLATALPELHRHGLLLLQGTPPHVCLAELGFRIAGVPGVLAVHDLHVWQLTEACLVASVHVHCRPGFETQKCGDLMASVTEVLRSVGVSRCTVQPEFLAAAGAADRNGPAEAAADAAAVARKTLAVEPPRQLCSLPCGKECAGKMCCTPQEESACHLAPPAGDRDVKPQVMIIENTFL